MATNGYTTLHTTDEKKQIYIAKPLLDYEGKVDAECKARFSPLHLASQEGHRRLRRLQEQGDPYPYLPPDIDVEIFPGMKRLDQDECESL